MAEAVRVDPSISSRPIPTQGEDLATICVLCSHNCGLRVDVAEGRIHKVRADESNPITKGYICNKGFRVGHYVDHRQRTTHPLRKKPEGGFERVSWDTALDEVAGKLSSILEAHGPRAIGLVGIGGQANHMDGPFGLSWLSAIGSKRWFNALAQEKTQHFLVDQLLFDASPTHWFHPDMEHTDLLLVLGTNPRISNRGHNANDTFKQLERSDTKMIVFDPRETETTAGADRHVRLRPGTDAWFLLGMASVIASGEGLADASFVAERTRGFEELRAALEPVSIDEMARRAEVSPDEIVSVAREFATADRAAIMYDLAVEQSPFSTLTSYLIRVLSTLTGNAGRRGGNIFMETQSAPEWSPRRFDEPERALASGIRSIAAVGGFPMFSPSLVPEEIELDHPERIRALIVEASNPILSYSDAPAWRRAFEKLDLLVVIDPAMTETAEFADYVLPTPTGYEKWELAGFPKGYPEIYVQLRPPVVPVRGEGLPEPEIYTRLTEKMRLITEPPARLFELAKHADSPEGAAAYFGALMEESRGNRSAVMFWGYRTLGPELPAPSIAAVWALCLENAVGRRDSVLRTLGADFASANPFELGLELFSRVMAHPEGVEIAKADADNPLDAALRHEDGRVHLSPDLLLKEIERAIATQPEDDPEYPFILGLGMRTRWTANTIQRDPGWRQGRGPFCALHLAPADAEALSLDPGDVVRITTRRSSADLPVALDKKLRQGHCWVPNGFGAVYPDEEGRPVRQGINLNELSDAADRDPITGCPHHKMTPCRLEAVKALAPAPA